MLSTQLNFMSQGIICAGTLLLPEHVKQAPVIIMAHGFGLIKDVGLPEFAKRFVKAGYAVFSFDYRCFGGSEGQPRHWVSPKRHLEDWKAALTFVRTLSSVDTQRIALWGYSFAGGHAIQTAAQDAHVSAVILQAPHVSGMSSLKGVPFTTLAKLSLSGVMDLFGGFVNKPVYRPIFGRGNDVAAMATAEAWDGYLSIAPALGNWQNKTRARIFLELPLYNPIRYVHKLRMPTLVISGKNDTIIPESAIRGAAQKMPNAQYFMLESNHFELCIGEIFEKNITLQLNFLARVLPVNNMSKAVA